MSHWLSARLSTLLFVTVVSFVALYTFRWIIQPSFHNVEFPEQDTKLQSFSSGFEHNDDPELSPPSTTALTVPDVLAQPQTAKFNWATVTQHYPLTSFQRLPTASPAAIPKIQFSEWHETSSQREIRLSRLDSVLNNFTHAWYGYKTHAWMKDEVGPLSGEVFDHFGGWAATLVDSLDTLWIMGLIDEFEEAVTAVELIDFSTCALDELNIFETTIRYLGGLLGAWDVSGGKYDGLLRKAMELGEMIYKAFDTPNRMPVVRWDWQSAKKGKQQEASDGSLVAELGSLTLELTRLAQITGDERYYDAVQRISDQFEKQQNLTLLPGLFPLVINPKDMKFNEGGLFTLGGMVDSLYEYLPKEYILLDGRSQQYRRLYEQALEQMKNHLFYRPMTPEKNDILFAGSVDVKNNSGTLEITLNPEVQHLTCFVGGMVALGAKAFKRPNDLDIAFKLVSGCTWGYDVGPMGILPEIMHTVPCQGSGDCNWDEGLWLQDVRARNSKESTVEEIVRDEHLPKGISRFDDTRYGLRPEAIESVFILYRITGNVKLQDTAWRMFESIVTATRTNIGAAALSDCTRPEVPPNDRMESFWLAETLKYFYLMFSEPNLVSLDEFVLNTEAHTLKRGATSVTDTKKFLYK